MEPPAAQGRVEKLVLRVAALLLCLVALSITLMFGLIVLSFLLPEPPRPRNWGPDQLYPPRASSDSERATSDR